MFDRSSICKVEMLKRFHNLVPQSENKQLLEYVFITPTNIKRINSTFRLAGKSYLEIKLASRNFQNAKEALHKQKFVNWIVNEPKYSSFSV